MSVHLQRSLRRKRSRLEWEKAHQQEVRKTIHTTLGVEDVVDDPITLDIKNVQHVVLEHPVDSVSISGHTRKFTVHGFADNNIIAVLNLSTSYYYFS